MEYGLVRRVACVSLLHGDSRTLYCCSQFLIALWHRNQNCSSHRNFDIAILYVAVWKVCEIRISDSRDAGDCGDGFLV